MLRGLWVGCAAVVLATAPLTARAQSTRDVAGVFFVSKSENRNQVHYGLHLDPACAPAGAAPVFVYWRMLEHGPTATEPLLSREVPAYGLAEQRVIERRADGGRIVVRLRALPDRPIEIASVAREGRCDLSATMRIGGVPASLESVFVQLRWPFGIDHLLLSGRSLADGRALHERIEH